MLFKKSVLVSFITLGIAIFSHNALAQDLYTTNNTKFDSTCRTNDFMCSTDILREDGVTRAGAQRKRTTGAQLKLACIKNLRDCKADIYMQDKCGGEKIAIIHFDTLGEGVKSIEMIDKSYLIIGSGFEVIISGGPIATK
ncbi:MAG: hypothetical protein A3F42_01570 [Gammaproteobacteria bacterium RIFCSPHIGHO2_12_FULL_37_34]|nr:MAG: hypothetical protein A3F42_01570 [Gammaproteobacteria bacterium RIFCSPHIGHO2_12_FULL_37_34]